VNLECLGSKFDRHPEKRVENEYRCVHAAPYSYIISAGIVGRRTSSLEILQVGRET